jgi:hypothetical protein
MQKWRERGKERESRAVVKLSEIGRAQTDGLREGEKEKG